MPIERQTFVELCRDDGGLLKTTSIDSAQKLCKSIATSHYENFPVASLLVPKKQRIALYAVYAFIRFADDVADEPGLSSEQRVSILSELRSCIGSGQTSTHPLVLALLYTSQNSNLNLECIERLLSAFESDVNFSQPNSWADLLLYCEHSANPVGEIVLDLSGENSPPNLLYSNQICTALQLINFWQDLSVDLARGRCYVPRDVLSDHGLDSDDLQRPGTIGNGVVVVTKVLESLYHSTENIMKEGSALVQHLRSPRLRFEIAATVEGGELVLSQCRSMRQQIFTSRPRIRTHEIAGILWRSLLRTFSVYKNTRQ